jgi:simple sugar transport system permease protein
MTATTDVSEKARRTNLRSTWWVTALIIGFGLVFFWLLLNLAIGGQCRGKCIIDTLNQTIRVATPIVFAALCGVMCERSGVINIGIEGQMLMAAMTAYAINLFSYQWLKTVFEPTTAGDISRWLALVIAVLSAVLLGALHAVVSIKFKADQIISGTVINIMAIGITGFIYHIKLAEHLPPGPGTFAIVTTLPSLSKIPIVGPILAILFIQKPLTYIMYILVILMTYVLFSTTWGLRTRATGEHPRAADTLGVNVIKNRYINVLLGSAIAGLGGAWFTLEAVDVFNPLMTNGLGFIGLAAMIFGKWIPFGAMLGALIFGLGTSVTSILSIFHPEWPSQPFQMLPYILTIIVLAGAVGRAVSPAADGKPYEKQ